MRAQCSNVLLSGAIFDLPLFLRELSITLKLELEKMSVQPSFTEKEIAILLLKTWKLRQTQLYPPSDLMDRKLQKSTTSHPTKTGELFDALAPFLSLDLLMNSILSINRPIFAHLCPAFEKKQGIVELQSTPVFQSDVAYPKVSLGVLAGFHSEKKYFRKEFGLNVCHLEKQVTVFKISCFTSKKSSFSFLFPPFLFPT